MKWWNKMVNKIKEPEKNKKLTNWQAKYEDAKAKYADTLSRMVIYEGYYSIVVSAKEPGRDSE